MNTYTVIKQHITGPLACIITTEETTVKFEKNDVIYSAITGYQYIVLSCIRK